MDRTLNYQTPVWLGDILIISRGEKNENQKKLFKTEEKLQEAVESVSEKKFELAGTRNNRSRNKTYQRKAKSHFRFKTTPTSSAIGIECTGKQTESTPRSKFSTQLFRKDQTNGTTTETETNSI